MNNSHTHEKEALLKKLQPHFPSRSQLPYLPEGWDGPDAYTRWGREQYETDMLPYWQNLAGAYQQALSTSIGNDAATLETCIEDWPDTFARQQKSLYELLETSKLRMAWRSQRKWTLIQKTYYTDGQRKVSAELEREHAEANCPLVEIPLYHGYFRASCQQLICMPVDTWESIYSDTSRYEPSQIDRITVERLATRVAQVFNTPPLAPMGFLQESPCWSDPRVWHTSLRGITSEIDSHGMTDRVDDEYGRPKNESDSMLFPDWRYQGFCGQIRVTLEDGTPWYVTVLAPTHFIRRLMIYVQWFERASTPDAPPSAVLGNND